LILQLIFHLLFHFLSKRLKHSTAFRVLNHCVTVHDQCVSPGHQRIVPYRTASAAVAGGQAEDWASDVEAPSTAWSKA